MVGRAQGERQTTLSFQEPRRNTIQAATESSDSAIAAATKTPVGPRSIEPREHVRERQLQQPEAQQVQPGRRARVAGAVEGLHHRHADRIEREAEADQAEAARAVPEHVGLGREEAHERRGEHDEHDRDALKKIVLYFVATQTEASARSGARAPKFWPTSVAAALLRPHAGKNMNIMMRIAIV